MRVDIDLFGDVQVSRELLRHADRVDDARPAFHEIADDLRAIERQQFDSDGGHGSGGWPDLAPSTIARKLASPNATIRSHANDILVATERLRRSLVDEHDADHVEIVQPHQLVFGTTVDYGRFHQLGEGVPQRRPLELREQDRRNVVRTLQRFLVETVER